MMGTRRLRHKIVLVVAALIGFGTVLLIRAEPAFAALACPRCFGFERLDGAIYVDPAMSADDRMRFMRAVDEGEARAASYLGPLRERPVIMACISQACTDRIGGGRARGMTYGSLGMRLSPLGLTPVIVAHERTHVEVYARLGLLRLVSGALPAWFDEGFAVLVSDDPRYLRPRGTGDRCVEEPGDDLPGGNSEWGRRAGVDHALYARAACRVVRWSEEHGGQAGLLSLIDDVEAGAPFETAWNRPRSAPVVQP